jgi:WhiB family redox-sensing transcriptional regulator
LFFPVSNRGPALIQVAQAKAVCARCPVLAQCRRHALVLPEPFGIWGGLTEEERDVLLAARSTDPNQVADAA